MARYCLIRNGVVENVIAWDGVAPWQAPAGYQVITDDRASPGWRYDGAVFTPPAPVPAPPPGMEERLKTAEADISAIKVRLGI